MQAVLYLFALKFLGRKEVEEMGEIRMTYFAELMQEEGRKAGREEGREEGRKEGEIVGKIEIIRKKYAKGYDVEIVADQM